jgi:photosystem II stability/assembly factor-like uncharacterized protein
MKTSIIKIILICLIFFLNNISSQVQGQSGWVQQNSGTTVGLESVSFPSQTTGYAVGTNIVLKTTNGGTSWTSQALGGEHLSVFFTTEGTGYVGTQGGVLKTTNGGINFFLQNNGVAGLIYAIFFTSQNPNLGYVTNSIDVYKTTDAGNNWVALNNISIDTYVSLFFANPNTGYVGRTRRNKENNKRRFKLG